MRNILHLSIIAGTIVSAKAWANEGPRMPFSGIAGGYVPDKASIIARSTVALKSLDGRGGENFCSGVLIDKNTVMTAAHCVAKAVSVQVILGESIGTPDYTTWARLVSYPQEANEYVAKNRFDAALVTLDSLPPSQFLSVQLAPQNAELKKDTTITVTGFGASGIGSFDNGLLKATQLAIVNERYSDMEILLKQTAETAVCPGDSGGPAFYIKNNQVFLLGVANAGLGEGSLCGDTVIYADVRSESLMSRLSEVTEILSKPGD